MNELRELYQDLILDHGRSPRNFKVVSPLNASADGHNPLCGDKCSVTLYVDENNQIADIGFQGKGCAISTASSSMMTQALLGKSTEEANKLFKLFHALITEEHFVPTPDDEKLLGKLIIFAGVKDYPSRVKCATLAWHTVNAALNNKNDIPVSTE